MPEQSVPVPQMRAWLVSYSGATPGIKYELGDGATCVGRGPQNDLVIQGPDVASVSIQHLEIRREAAGFRLRDLDSTNGTYLNGERITEVDLCATATIRFGSQGPELTFTTAEPAAAELDKTMAIPEGIQQPPALEPAAPSGTYEGLLSAAVKRDGQHRSQWLPAIRSGVCLIVTALAPHVRQSSGAWHVRRQFDGPSSSRSWKRRWGALALARLISLRFPGCHANHLRTGSAALKIIRRGRPVRTSTWSMVPLRKASSIEKRRRISLQTTKSPRSCSGRGASSPSSLPAATAAWP